MTFHENSTVQDGCRHMTS